MQAIKRARIKPHQRKALRDGTCAASSLLSLLDFMDIAAHRRVGRDFDIWFDDEQAMKRGKFLV